MRIVRRWLSLVANAFWPSHRNGLAWLTACWRVVRARVLVSGKVQGVFYRDSTKKEADKRGVHGWVRNLRDGRVEAVFEGPAREVDAMVAWCKVGSPLARVTFVDRKDEPEEGLAGYEIRQTL